MSIRNVSNVAADVDTCSSKFFFQKALLKLRKKFRQLEPITASSIFLANGLQELNSLFDVCPRRAKQPDA